MLSYSQIAKIRKQLSHSGQSVIFQAPREVNRYLIFEMLVKQPRLTVGAIAQNLKLSRFLASRQIKALEQINIIEKEKKGQRAFYKFKTDNAVAQAIMA